jgi:hypothetical protein
MNKILIGLLVPLLLIGLSNKAEGETSEPRGEIRVSCGSSSCRATTCRRILRDES